MSPGSRFRIPNTRNVTRNRVMIPVQMRLMMYEPISYRLAIHPDVLILVAPLEGRPLAGEVPDLLGRRIQNVVGNSAAVRAGIHHIDDDVADRLLALFFV